MPTTATDTLIPHTSGGGDGWESWELRDRDHLLSKSQSSITLIEASPTYRLHKNREMEKHPSPKFLNDLDVTQVDVDVFGRVDNSQHGIDTDGRQDARVLRYYLRLSSVNILRYSTLPDTITTASNILYHIITGSVY